MMSKSLVSIISVLFVSMPSVAYAGESLSLTSPDGIIVVEITTDEGINFRVRHGDRMVIEGCSISLDVEKRGSMPADPADFTVSGRSVDEVVYPVIREKSAVIHKSYNELCLVFPECSIEFRAFDSGFAYRFRTDFDDNIIVSNEMICIVFPENAGTFFPEEESFLTHSERKYLRPRLDEISQNQMCSLPMIVAFENEFKVAITEADLFDYPGLYLRGNNNRSLSGLFPAVATKENQTRDRTVEVVERASYIAETSGDRTFPWRVFVFAEEDRELVENQMVYLLARPLELLDTSWIRPGKVAWDWWNANNIYGVDFRAGINTDTYTYYIDFAAKHGIEYVILDEGWYELWDLYKINPDINMPELLAYAKEKDVGIILWVVWKTLDDQLEILDTFEEWGVAGIKVDFMQRDDQWMVNYYWKIAREAAKRHLLVDFHGSYKPTGLRRAYPNVITREGVRGLEHVKWSDFPTPEHNTILPFTRMLAGPMDYTPGAMNNAQQKNFRYIFDRPMSMTTRCHQLALYVIFESPLQMLADSPSNYLKEPECMQFLAAVPTVWDETRVLDAAIADYVIVARRNGEDWFIGAITDEKGREFEIDLSFLGDREYTMLEYHDGINADRYASDFKTSESRVDGNSTAKIRLAPSGGWAAHLSKR